MNYLLSSLLLFVCFYTVAQTTPDTIRKEKRRYYAGQTQLKQPKTFTTIFHALDDEPLKKSWKQARVATTAASVSSLGGSLLILGGSLSSMNGNDGSSLYGGGLALLTGGIVSAILGKTKFKQSIRRYNSLATQRAQVVPNGDLLLPAHTNDRSLTAVSAKIGSYAGIARSRVRTNQADYFDEDLVGTTGFHIGIPIEVPLEGNTSFRADLSYSQLGFGLLEKTETPSQKKRVKANARQSYISLPISIKLHFPSKVNMVDQFYLLPGISIGYANRTKIVTNSFTKTDTRTVKLRTEEKIRMDDLGFSDRLDAGIHLGLGMTKYFWNGEIFFETKFHAGVLNLDRNAPGIYDEQPKTYNRSIMIALGYMQPF